MAAIHCVMAGSGIRAIIAKSYENVNGLVLTSAGLVGYQPGNSDIEFRINGNIGANSTTGFAIELLNTFDARDNITIKIASGVFVVGAGGRGGNGWYGGAGDNRTSGGNGGHAINVLRPVTIINLGVVGGGGGGGGVCAVYDAGNITYGAPGSGGGGAGLPAGSAGTNSDWGEFRATAGASGSLASGGARGYNGQFPASLSGAGGDLGSAGGTPAQFLFGPSGPTSPGNAGIALVGKNYVNGGNGLTGTVFGQQLTEDQYYRVNPS